MICDGGFISDLLGISGTPLPFLSGPLWCVVSVCHLAILAFCFFQFGPIMNKVAMNIKSFCGHKFLCLLGKYLGLGLPGHRVGKYLD